MDNTQAVDPLAQQNGPPLMLDLNSSLFGLDVSFGIAKKLYKSLVFWQSLPNVCYTTKHLIVSFIQEDSAPGNEGEEVRVDEDCGDPTSPTEDDVKELIAPKKSAVQKKRD